MPKPPFTVMDNPEQRSNKDEVKILHPLNDHVTAVWTMSFEDLVELQYSITSYMAGPRIFEGA